MNSNNSNNSNNNSNILNLIKLSKNYKKYIIEKIFLIKQLFLQYNIINPGLNILHYITIIDYEDPIKTLFKKIIYDYENKNIKENKNNIIKNLFSYKKIYNFEIPEILLKNLYSPISHIGDILNKQKTLLIFNICIFILQVGSFYFLKECSYPYPHFNIKHLHFYL